MCPVTNMFMIFIVHCTLSIPLLVPSTLFVHQNQTKIVYLHKSSGTLLFLWVVSALCLDVLDSLAVCSVIDLEWQIILQWCFLDRYVILGGHRDSWVFGGIDPQSGAAVVHEIVRSFGTLKKEGNVNSKGKDHPLWISIWSSVKCVELPPSRRSERGTNWQDMCKHQVLGNT